jgi:poly-gamma-glutamate capsule biosynthesis protein CapA/YwtB (metallophosphatase superfamily)
VYSVTSGAAFVALTSQLMAALDFIFAGDLVLDEPDPDHWLGGIASAVRAADVAIGHLEVPHSRRGSELHGDVPAPSAPPEHLPAIARAGFTAVSLAGNHIADSGGEAIADTLQGLDRTGVVHAGAGMNLAEARAPAIVTRGAVRIGLLSYNCVGPQSAWATPTSAGCAYVRVNTSDGGPINPRARLHSPDPASMAAMASDILEARKNADVVIVSLHKGIVHTPAQLAPYERELAEAAIDAGCDIVLGHHAHIVRGIQIYRGRPIFHGLGNGCVVTRALSPHQQHPERAAWARRRRELFGFEPDPAYYLAPFHPDAVNAMLGRVRLQKDGSMHVGFVPVHVEPPGRPVLAHAAVAARVADYVAAITVAAGLPPLSMRSTGDVVWVS